MCIQDFVSSFVFPDNIGHCRHCPNHRVCQPGHLWSSWWCDPHACLYDPFCLHKWLWYIARAHIPTFFSIDYWCDQCRFCADSRTWDIFPIHPLSLWFAISTVPCFSASIFFSTRKSRDSIALCFSDFVMSLTLIGLEYSQSCSCFISLNAALRPCFQTSWCLFVGYKSPSAM